jgi:hypothetical protein
LLVEAARSYAHDRSAVAMVIVAELRELLPRNEEGRLPVREALFRLGKLKRCGAHAI